mmetsp:Transcript_34842/g.64079  ORF Transcript_34842/g.64079 Transcript_34842/m.64079 type:complete len:284 (+) Transcript_34842:643-1494(+)
MVVLRYFSCPAKSINVTMRNDALAISSSLFILFERILSRPAMVSPVLRNPSRWDEEVEVRPLSISCRCFMMDVREDPRPSSRKEVVRVPMRVDFPASTFPTTATRMLREERVSWTDTGCSSVETVGSSFVGEVALSSTVEVVVAGLSSLPFSVASTAGSSSSLEDADDADSVSSSTLFGFFNDNFLVNSFVTMVAPSAPSANDDPRDNEDNDNGEGSNKCVSIRWIVSSQRVYDPSSVHNFTLSFSSFPSSSSSSGVVSSSSSPASLPSFFSSSSLSSSSSSW